MDISIRRETARKVGGLYVIVDAQVAQGRDLVDLSRAALQGGAQVIQLRDKLHDKGDVLPVARAIRELCATDTMPSSSSTTTPTSPLPAAPTGCTWAGTTFR